MNGSDHKQWSSAIARAMEEKSGGEVVVAESTPSTPRPPTSEELRLFGDMFCAVLGDTYKTLRRGEPIASADECCFPFYFGDAPSHAPAPGEDERGMVDRLIAENGGEPDHGERRLLVFTGNMALLVMPSDYHRYWTEESAWREACGAFASLMDMGF